MSRKAWTKYLEEMAAPCNGHQPAKGGRDLGTPPEARRRLEEDLQCSISDTLDLLRFRWCHCPNGGTRDERTGAALKAQGVKRGVPDVLIFDAPIYLGPEPAGFYAGTVFEVKSPTGELTPDQADWIEDLSRRCHWATPPGGIIRSTGELVDFLRPLYPHKFR